MALSGRLDPVIGRDEEIRRVVQTLTRRTKNNPVIIGDAGVGKTADDYCAVLFHELTHSNGHASWLDRGLGSVVAPFGSPDCSKEELVAELGSTFLNNASGIHNDLSNSAAYIANWLRVVRDDKSLIVLCGRQSATRSRLHPRSPRKGGPGMSTKTPLSREAMIDRALNRAYSGEYD